MTGEKDKNGSDNCNCYLHLIGNGVVADLIDAGRHSRRNGSDALNDRSCVFKSVCDAACVVADGLVDAVRALIRLHPKNRQRLATNIAHPCLAFIMTIAWTYCYFNHPSAYRNLRATLVLLLPFLIGLILSSLKLTARSGAYPDPKRAKESGR